MVKPYLQHKKDDLLIRLFKESIDEQDLVWHRDHCDREIVATSGRDWKIQYDNRMPEKIEIHTPFHVKKNEYHRLIKGKGHLTLHIKEL